MKNIRPEVLRAGFVVLTLVGLFVTAVGVKSYQNLQSQAAQLNGRVYSDQQTTTILQDQLASASGQIQQLQSEDQRVRNNALEAEIAQIKKTFAAALVSYQEITDLKEGKGKGLPMDKTFALILDDLSKENYASASALLAQLSKDIQTEQTKQIATVATATSSNTAPANGFSRQQVSSDVGSFVVDLVAGDLNSTRVVIDTASDSTCGNNCPVMPLSAYVARSGAYAGVNGSYFCPTSYPQCAGKTNSFDLLVMNKKRTYFNSDNNVYSQNPVAIFSGTSARFLPHAQDWGRDTGVDAVISNFPLLLLGNQIQFGGNDDAKMTIKSNRAFIANKGSIAYIGVLHGVTVVEGAHVLKALGMDNAINLDSGGSTAMWANGGYKDGPGRDLPNVVLFVRK